MKISYLTVAMIVSMSLAIALPYLTDGIFTHAVIVGLIVLLSLVLMLAAGVMFPFSCWRDSAPLKHRSRTLFSISVVGVVQWLSIPIINHINQTQLTIARSYCESFVPEVERYKKQNGRCPILVDELAATDEVPDFLRGQQVVQLSNNTESAAENFCDFSCQFHLPGSPPLITHRYNSTTREWMHGD